MHDLLVQGEPGLPGDRGAPGKKGMEGAVGDQGKKGDPGLKGQPVSDFKNTLSLLVILFCIFVLGWWDIINIYIYANLA